MSKTLELSDEQYQIIKDVAESKGRTPEELLLAWAMDAEGRYRHEHPTYYETDDWMRHLGVGEDVIAEVNRAAAEEDVKGTGGPAGDADA